MLNIATFKLKKLIQLANDKAKSLENYLAFIGVDDGIEDDDRAYIAEQLAELVFFQDLRDELQAYLNQQ